MISLEKYFESDPNFAQEMLSTFIDNLIEFRTSLLLAVNEQDPKIFTKSCHKMKSTLGFTQNDRLQKQADLLKSMIQEKGMSGIDTRALNLFCRMCTSAINELEEKRTIYKTAV